MSMSNASDHDRGMELTRRSALRLLAGAAGATLLAACGGTSAPASTASSPAASPSSAAAKPSVAASPAKPAASAAGSAKPAASAGAASAKPGASGSAAASLSGPKVDALYEAAKKEGEIIWTDNFTPARHQAAQDAFQQRFPGIKVTFVQTDTPTLPNRLLTEAAANKVSVDAFRGSGRGIQPLVDKGLIATTDFKALGVPDSEIARDGLGIWYDDALNAFFYNTKMVSEADRPKKLDDLVDPKWKGKLVTQSTGSGFQQLLGMWTPDQVVAWVKQLAKQDMIIANTAIEALNKVASGEGYFLMSIGLDMVLDLVNTQKAPLAVLETDPTWIWVSPNMLLTMKGSPHPNAAQLFMAWLTTSEGKGAMGQAGIGRNNPCNGGTATDKAVCGKDYKYYVQDTPEKEAVDIKLRQDIVQALGLRP